MLDVEGFDVLTAADFFTSASSFAVETTLLTG